MAELKFKLKGTGETKIYADDDWNSICIGTGPDNNEVYKISSPDEQTIIISEVSVKEISIDKPSLTLTIGNYETITATVLPENAINKNITWSSSNEDVATVKNGVVTAVSAGETIITVTTEDGGKTAACTVIVKQQVEEISLDKSSATIVTGEYITLTATVLPENATNKNITWSSSNEDVATVKNGVVTAVSPGQAIIIAITEDGSKTAVCMVTVKSPSFSGTITRINNKIVVNTTLDRIVTQECLHIALYNDKNAMIDYIIVPTVKPLDHINVVFKDNPDASYAKIFLWNSIESSEPITDAVKIEIK